MLKVHANVTRVFKNCEKVPGVSKKKTIANLCTDSMFSHAFLKTCTFGTIYRHQKKDFLSAYYKIVIPVSAFLHSIT